MLFNSHAAADYEVVRLQEDITLAGFTPLMYKGPEPIFTHKSRDMEEAQVRFGQFWTFEEIILTPLSYFAERTSDPEADILRHGTPVHV